MFIKHTNNSSIAVIGMIIMLQVGTLSRRACTQIVSKVARLSSNNPQRHTISRDLRGCRGGEGGGGGSSSGKSSISGSSTTSE